MYMRRVKNVKHKNKHKRMYGGILKCEKEL